MSVKPCLNRPRAAANFDSRWCEQFGAARSVGLYDVIVGGVLVQLVGYILSLRAATI